MYFDKIAFITCIVIGFPIPFASIIIGAENSDHECQEEDEVGISLYQWLIGAGISMLILLCCLLVLFGCNKCKINPKMFKISCFWMVIYLIFNTIYLGVGLAVYFRSSLDCLTEGTSIGIVGLIQLIVYAVPYIILILWCTISILCAPLQGNTTVLQQTVQQPTMQQTMQPTVQGQRQQMVEQRLQERQQQQIDNDRNRRQYIENLFDIKISDTTASVLGVRDKPQTEDKLGDDDV